LSPRASPGAGRDPKTTWDNGPFRPVNVRAPKEASAHTLAATKTPPPIPRKSAPATTVGSRTGTPDQSFDSSRSEKLLRIPGSEDHWKTHEHTATASEFGLTSLTVLFLELGFGAGVSSATTDRFAPAGCQPRRWRRGGDRRKVRTHATLAALHRGLRRPGRLFLAIVGDSSWCVYTTEAFLSPRTHGDSAGGAGRD
jgi:hypothetical protein